MSGITLSSSVRQNLLSLQSTADLLSTTQNRLATGKKVNSALDNATNFFTAASLDARSSDINNLLDGIGNGVQVLQAANTGITSIQKLVDTAKSIANQALQTSVGYTKSAVVGAAVGGATASNLLGTTTYTSKAATAGTGLTNGLTSGTAVSAASVLQGGSTTVDGLASAITTSDSFTVNGKTVSFNSAGAGDTTDASGNVSIDLGTTASNTVGHLLSVIDTLSGNTGTGSVASTVTAFSGTQGKIQLNTGVASDLVLGGTSATLTKLGLVAATNSATRTAATALGGKTLTIGATGGGTATNITFGTGAGQVSNLNDLNTKLAANNLQATIDTTGSLTLTTTNDAASSNIGTVGGTAQSTTGAAFASSSVVNAVADPNSQATRASLVAQYNQTIAQITTTAQDSSFNGVNLLNGDNLKLTFNETGKSSLSITGVNFQPAGLGLTTLASGTDFIDNASTNKVLTSLTNASTSLRSQSSAFGSNLSVRADPSGLLEEPDQRAADRLVQPDARRHQRGSGQQPGAVDPPVDRGVRAVARQHLAAERVAATSLSSAS